MTITDAWRDLAQRRFPELPLACGNERNPGVRFCEDLRDWSTKETTFDQRRMENYIDRYDLRAKRVLHVGIGSSGLAARFSSRVKEIVGTTIDKPEIQAARSLSLHNYRALLHNKYSGDDAAIDGQFDFILDNNPTSPCCCVGHLATLFNFYAKKLASGGQVVTDHEGLAWIPPDSNPRWSFDFDDLAAVAATAGLTAFRIDRTICVIARSAPPTPGWRSRAGHIARRILGLPGQIARIWQQNLERIGRRLSK